MNTYVSNGLSLYALVRINRVFQDKNSWLNCMHDGFPLFYTDAHCYMSVCRMGKMNRGCTMVTLAVCQDLCRVTRMMLSFRNLQLHS